MTFLSENGGPDDSVIDIIDAENEISPQDASRSLTNEVNMSSRNEILTNSNESENAIHSDPTTEDRTMSLPNDHESDEQTSDNNDQSENPALSLANSFVPSPRNEFSSISVIQRNVIPDSLSAEIQRNAEEIFQEPNQNEDKGDYLDFHFALKYIVKNMDFDNFFFAPQFLD